MVGNNSNLEIFNRIKETNANSADEYSNSKTYVKDEYCIYNNTLYKANQAIDTAEEFTESHWTETTVGTELKSQADSISALNSSIVVNEFLKTQDILEGVQSYVTFNEEMIPDGYSVITAWCTSGHPSSVLCGGPYVEKNMAVVPYIARHPEQGEKFHLYIVLKRS